MKLNLEDIQNARKALLEIKPIIPNNALLDNQESRLSLEQCWIEYKEERWYLIFNFETNINDNK